nr:MAG TPA: hypothetical protein [Caudoviricetes sp.]
MNLVGNRIPNIKTGFWRKIVLENQKVIREIYDFNVIDVIQYQHTSYIITNKRI